MLPFRSEIRNSPTRPTLKIYLSDESLDEKIKEHLEGVQEIEMIELRESIGRNRSHENITVFFKDDVDIVKTKTRIDTILEAYFEEGTLNK